MLRLVRSEDASRSFLMQQNGFLSRKHAANFISYPLDNQNTERDQTPASDLNTNPASNMVPSPPQFPPIRRPRSPNSTDSNVDVTAYAEERVRALEEAQILANQSDIEQVAENFGEIEEAMGSVEEEEMVES